MRRSISFVALLLSLAVPALAKSTNAERYDVTIRTLADGSIQVTETVRVTFSGGPFTSVNREISTRMTDGIEVLGASMDGRVMTRGGDPGQFDVRMRDSRVAVRWHFAPTSDAAHDFRLSYLARGVVRRAGDGGVLEWQALPGEHAYAIGASRIVLEGEGLDREPSVQTRRVGGTRTERVTNGWAIEASAVGANGWVRFATPAPLVGAATPQWQLRQERQWKLMPRMLQFGALAAVLSFAIVLLIRRQYPSPPLIDGDAPRVDRPPVPRAPAFAAAIVAGGRSSYAHAPGTLFDLASRGSVTIEEAPGRWKALRSFTMKRQPAGRLAPHESALLDVMFRQDESVDFRKGAGRLVRGGRAFHRTVRGELQQLGLIDEQRGLVRRRLFVAGIALGMLSVAALALAFLLIRDAGPWTLAIMLGIDLAGALALVLGATLAELSDEGFRERERWRGFKRALKEKIGSNSTEPLTYLPYVVALGLGGPLSRYLKKHGDGAVLPPWFHAIAGQDGSAAFAAFIGVTAASTGSGAASGSGAAGGGSSSAG